MTARTQRRAIAAGTTIVWSLIAAVILYPTWMLHAAVTVGTVLLLGTVLAVAGAYMFVGLENIDDRRRRRRQ